MTSGDRARKRAIRDRMAETGEPYAVAARRHDESRATVARTGPVEESYMQIATGPDQPVARTAEIVEHEVLVDLDANGDVIGIERLGGPVDAGTLATVIRWMVAP